MNLFKVYKAWLAKLHIKWFCRFIEIDGVTWFMPGENVSWC